MFVVIGAEQARDDPAVASAGIGGHAKTSAQGHGFSQTHFCTPIDSVAFQRSRSRGGMALVFGTMSADAMSMLRKLGWEGGCAQ
jgi:hypothetical protein